MIRSKLYPALMGVVLVAVSACSKGPGAGGQSRPGITFVGVAELPGDSRDLSGLKEKLSDGTPHDQVGGLSAVAYTGQGDEYIHLADRGPKDGATEYACRFHRMAVRVRPGESPPVELKLVATTLLTDEKGRRFVGSLTALGSGGEPGMRLDPEGVRVGRGGSLFVSDEYGPSLEEFDAKGRRVRSLPVPARFRVARPAKTPEAEMPPANAAGRVPNRGMEGLAITPDGKKLYGILQGPLIQDGALGVKNRRVGVNCRLLEVEVATGRTRELVYQLDSPANGVNEILAVNDRQFLVLERDSKGGNEAASKKVTLIDVTGATDVSEVAALPSGALPEGVKAVRKEAFLDLLDGKFPIAGAGCPEKFEGLAFGPDLPDGRRLLIVTSDNDFVRGQPYRVYAFAIERGELPGLEPQQFDAGR